MSKNKDVMFFETDKGLLLFEAIFEKDVPIFTDVYLDDRFLGTIFLNCGDWELILSGVNPIEEGWQNGGLLTCTYDGWTGINKKRVV